MLTSDQVLSAYFLDTRCKLIEIAAMLDRFDRANAREIRNNTLVDGGASQNGSGTKGGGQKGTGPATIEGRDERLNKLYGALQLLAEPGHPQMNRSEQLLLMFSDLT